MQKRKGTNSRFAPAAVLGLFIGAWTALGASFLSDALAELLSSRRVVTVKGFAEREVDANLALASALSARGDMDAAIAAVRAVLERDAENLQAHAVLSRVLLSAGMEAEAVRELGELVDLLERGGVLEKREFTE